MRAFIFNSGSGTRMQPLTLDNPKALVYLHNFETILHRQIRILRHVGIQEFVITTGPFAKQIEAIANSYPDLTFYFVANPDYATTNSIYSMYLAKDYLNQDCLMMHGDLVFTRRLVEKLLSDPRKDLACINSKLPQPLKDFKGRMKDGKLQQISVTIFDEDCYAFQPLYKLSKSTLQAWNQEVAKMVNNQEVKVYAENALNKILPTIDMECIDYHDDYINEIDTLQDLDQVSKDIALFDYSDQWVIESNDYLRSLEAVLEQYVMRRPLYVISEHLLKDETFLNYQKDNHLFTFHEFSPNPTLQEVEKGLALFHQHQCDSLIAIGGGSSLDVAKTIKLFSKQNPAIPYLQQAPLYVDVPLIALPTTAGTGSESTRFAVIYDQGEKQSLTQDCLLPDVAILDASFLKPLPYYPKVAALLDALSQAIESLWSLHSTPTSKAYATKALQLILQNYSGYVNQKDNAASKIMLAANLAGRAINLSQTTAPHAMSYKITSLTNIAHGHAVALCLPVVLEYMLSHDAILIDPRGYEHWKEVVATLLTSFKVSNEKQLVIAISKLYASFELPTPTITEAQLQILIDSVNPIRLKNHPIQLDKATIAQLYRRIFFPK